MRAKRTVLVGGLLLATVLGVAGGYATGVLSYPSSVTVSGVAAPLGGITTSPTTVPLPIKTAEPNDYAALDPDALSFHQLEFTIDLVQNAQGVDPPPVRLSVRVPRGWKQSVTDKGEAKFIDSTGTRWIRVAPVYPIKQTPRQKRDQLVPSLQSSIPHEQVFKVLRQSDDAPVGIDERKRRVSQLTYSYIPIKWLRPVIVEYVATADQDAADFEMSVTGFPQDQAALNLIAEKAAVSVLPED